MVIGGVSGIARIVRDVMSSPSVASLFQPLTRDRGIIMRLHRLRDSERDTPGRDPEMLRQVLAYLRRESYELLPLLELLRRLDGEGPPLRRAVAFTIDDGYVDQAEIGAPLFAEFDCPVTTFVTTGFIDGRIWFWWDKISYVFRHTQVTAIEVVLDDRELRYRWSDHGERDRACEEFAASCKRVGDAEKHAAIARLAEAAEVELPGNAPERYAPMSWSQLRECERLGMTFGPHTVTHPILSQTSDEASHREIVDSWGRLKAEARSPVPVFAYPNGLPGDFGQREIDVLREAGLAGAVMAISGYNSAADFRARDEFRFKLRRFGRANELAYVVRCVTGVERLSQIMSRVT